MSISEINRNYKLYKNIRLLLHMIGAVSMSIILFIPELTPWFKGFVLGMLLAYIVFKLDQILEKINEVQVIPVASTLP